MLFTQYTLSATFWYHSHHPDHLLLHKFMVFKGSKIIDLYCLSTYDKIQGLWM